MPCVDPSCELKPFKPCKSVIDFTIHDVKMITDTMHTFVEGSVGQDR